MPTQTPFWRPQREPIVHRLQNMPVGLAPLIFEDGRCYDLCEIQVCDQHAEGYDIAVPRWSVTMEAQERASGESFFFKSNILNARLKSELQLGSPNFCRQRHPEILVAIARKRVEDYLRSHFIPSRSCPNLCPIILEIG